MTNEQFNDLRINDRVSFDGGEGVVRSLCHGLDNMPPLCACVVRDGHGWDAHFVLEPGEMEKVE